VWGHGDSVPYDVATRDALVDRLFAELA
jgi:hypothetical protein